MKPDKRLSKEDNDTLTMSAAAKLSGKSVSTIRRWIDDGFLPAKKTQEGWRVVAHHDLMATLSRVPQDASREVKGSRPGATAGYPHESSLIAVIEASLKREQEALEHERRMSAELREQNKTLQSELLKLTREMQAMLSKDAGGALSRWLRS
jgi:DNA-binding transcriptional MerR regulator